MSEQVNSNARGSTNVAELSEMREELFEQIAALAIALDKGKANPLIRRLRALDTAIARLSPSPIRRGMRVTKRREMQ